MAYNLADELKKDAEQYGMGGGKRGDGYFNIEEGNKNVCRILTPAVSFVQYFNKASKKTAIAYGSPLGDPRQEDDENTKRVRYATYVIDRSDGKVKLATFSYSVMKAISMLQENPDYQFEDIPMPYDIRITFKKDESPATMYTVTAAANRDSVTPDETKMLEEAMSNITPHQFVEKMKENQIKKDKEAGVWDKEAAEENEKKAQKLAEKSSSTDYPKDDINPEDIPF